MESQLLMVFGGIFILLVFASLKQVNEYERGIRFTFGKFTDVIMPGWRIVWPIVQSWQKVDIRTKVVEEPDQEVITQDNVSAKITAVIYYKIVDAQKGHLSLDVT